MPIKFNTESFARSDSRTCTSTVRTCSCMLIYLQLHTKFSLSAGTGAHFSRTAVRGLESNVLGCGNFPPGLIADWEPPALVGYTRSVQASTLRTL